MIASQPKIERSFLENSQTREDDSQWKRCRLVLAVILAVALGAVAQAPVDLRMNVDTASTIAEFAREPNSDLIVAVGSIAQIQRDLTIKLAAQYRLPTTYPYRFFVEAGGLVSYGPNLVEGYRRAASYVDRILRGEKPGDLPVQAPTKYELVVNLKTAKALGQNVPPSLLARADEVIE